MKRFLILAAVALCFAATQSAKAWNNIGHATIAVIAERHLTDEAKEKCRSYLKHNLPYYAAWMDYWRNCPGFEHTSSWHGVPVDENNKQIKGETNNAAYQINRICKKMRKYHKLKDSIVADNLKYLIHMVGDMHCPSHTGYPDQPAYKGYNLYRSGKKTGFHTFWDASPGYLHKGWTCEDFHRNLDKMKPKKIAKMVKGTAEDWARQNGEEMREVYTLIPHNAEYTALPERDRKRAVEICEQQMLRGAYRLAYVLNEIFEE